FSLVFSPDSRLVSAGTTQGTVHVWEVASGKKICQLDGLPGYVIGLAFSNDGKTLAAGGWMEVRLWEVATGQERARFTDLEGDVIGLAFSPGDRVLACGTGDGSILLWDLTGHIAGRRPAGHSTHREVEEAMADLLGQDTDKAYQALWTLAWAPRQ